MGADHGAGAGARGRVRVPSYVEVQVRGLLLAACVMALGPLALAAGWSWLASSGGGRSGASLTVTLMVVGVALVVAPPWYAVTGARTRFWRAWARSRGWSEWHLGVYDLPAEPRFTAPGARIVHHSVRGTIAGRDVVLCEVEVGGRWTTAVIDRAQDALVAAREGRADHAQELDGLCDAAAAASVTTPG